MSFSTNTFLFFLFPVLLLVSFVFRKKTELCKIGLLLANLVFYFLGDFKSFLILIPFTLAISIFSQILSKDFKGKKIFFTFSIIFATCPLVLYKYLTTVNKNILLPVGISFYTFQAISLLADIYLKKNLEKTDFLSVSAYLTFFPTVVSGPITRFNTFKKGFNLPVIKKENFEKGMTRFTLGLSKKVLIADKLIPLVNYYYDPNVTQISVLGIWFASIAYSLELYFDFAGYSDMAIGLAKIFGFDLEENFNNPYLADSISDFWKRWHISLTKWFKDYIYIPLGGNRCSIPRHLFNMLIVWLFTGLWHGVNWTFILWGLLFLALLIIEKYCKKFAVFIANHKVFGHIYALLMVNIAWVLFRSPSLSRACMMIKGLVGIGSAGTKIEPIAIEYIPLLITGILICLPWNKFFEKYQNTAVMKIGKIIGYTALTVLCCCAVVNSTFTAFIYGNF